MPPLKMIAFESPVSAEKLTELLLQKDTSHASLLDQHLGIRKTDTLAPLVSLEIEDLSFHPSIRYCVIIRNGELWAEHQLQEFLEQFFSEKGIGFSKKILEPFRSPNEAKEALLEKCSTPKV